MDNTVKAGQLREIRPGPFWAGLYLVISVESRNSTVTIFHLKTNRVVTWGLLYSEEDRIVADI